jgi:hypothetical protein
MRAFAKGLVLVALLGAVPALADERSPPPARVGRVGVVSGTLAYYGPGDSNWSAAKVNLPVAVGGWFATDPKSRAQLRIGPDSVSLDRDTQLDFADLREKVMQIALTQGRVHLHVRRREWRKDEDVEVDLARGGLWLLQPGEYDVDGGAANQPTRITVFEGSAKFVGSGIEMDVKAGERLVLSGGTPLVANVERGEIDDFVRWCRANDYRAERLAQALQVSPTMTGFEELAAYGAWSSDPNYGAVWYPNDVSADWAPYREGHWVWIEPWGWNWVDDEPWGFAPFHYGRWARIGGRWGWAPGEVVAQPVYAPALVAFIPPPALMAGVAAGAGPPVGWFPLAPGEVYWPDYAADRAYVRRVNIANVSRTRIDRMTAAMAARGGEGRPPAAIAEQRFANRGAAIVVPARVLEASAPVAPAALKVRPQVLQHAAVALAPPVAPERAAAGRAVRPGEAAFAVATPKHPPARPQFTHLAPAPRIAQAASAPGPAAAPARATSASPPADHAPVAKPAIARLPEQRPGPADAAKPAPLHPPGRPDFAHLPPWHPGPHPPQAPETHAVAAPPTNAAPPSAHAEAPRPSDHRPPPELAGPPRAPATDRTAQERAAEDRAAQEHAAQEHAAQQRAAQEAVQQRAAQAAVQQRAAQAAVQQRAAQQRAAQQRAAQAAARQHSVQACGHPGQPPCPK